MFADGTEYVHKRSGGIITDNVTAGKRRMLACLLAMKTWWAALLERIRVSGRTSSRPNLAITKIEVVMAQLAVSCETIKRVSLVRFGVPILALIWLLGPSKPTIQVLFYFPLHHKANY